MVRRYASYPGQKRSPLFLLLKQPHMRPQAHPSAATIPTAEAADRPGIVLDD